MFVCFVCECVSVTDVMFCCGVCGGSLHGAGDETRARQQFEEFEKLFGELDDETKGSDPDILLQKNLLTRALA
jgi:hypothetical protein